MFFKLYISYHSNNVIYQQTWQATYVLYISGGKGENWLMMDKMLSAQWDKKKFILQLTHSKYKTWIQPEPINPVRLSNRYCFYGYVHLEEFLSYHSPAAWWNSQPSCAGLPPRSSQTGGKGPWTSRHRAQRSKYLGRCHSPSPGSNLKRKEKAAKRWRNGKFSCDFHIFHY